MAWSSEDELRSERERTIMRVFDKIIGTPFLLAS
jgi:hypothetical protein